MSALNLCETLDINGLLRLAEVHFSARGWRSFVYYFIGDVYCAYSIVSDSLAHALKARTTIASPHIRTPELVKTETVITWREIASPCACVRVYTPAFVSQYARSEAAGKVELV